MGDVCPIAFHRTLACTPKIRDQDGMITNVIISAKCQLDSCLKFIEKAYIHQQILVEAMDIDSWIPCNDVRLMYDRGFFRVNIFLICGEEVVPVLFIRKNIYGK